MNPSLQREIMHLEGAVLTCFTLPTDAELPQVADEDEMVIELLHDAGFGSHELITASLHHQIDPAYQ